ncbi:MAG: efflux RND transporter permease subunit [Leptonema illini]|uniref:Efflux RND transporter permease subunit n=1 Tax=Leptonema illini TaxID=183 RepID=A0A833H1D5_9LEPT|nr:MAG: efflux RND transporter permease subunit [Leptonema illini]
MNIASFSIKRPTLITSLVLLMLVSGYISMKRIGVDLFPDVNIPVVVVNTIYPGAGPEEVEEQISRLLEDELSSISGLKRISSYNYEGMSVVVAEFNLSTDIKYAEQQVRNHTDRVRNDFPDEAREPVVSRVDPADQSIMRLAVFADLSPAALYDLADQTIKPELSRVEDVGKVDILGGTKREIQIHLDRKKLNEYKISALQVATSLRSAGKNVPVGNVEKQTLDLSYRLDGEFKSLRDVETTLISFSGDITSGVQVKDLGTVVDTVKDVETLGFLYAPVEAVEGKQNGIIDRIKGIFSGGSKAERQSARRPALFIDVYKRSGSNTVAVADGILNKMEKLNTTLSSKTGNPSMTLVRDGARPIRLNIADVSEAIMLGVLFAVIVVYFFLGNMRSTIITGIALPNSLLGAFIIMYAMGFTINLMSLLALSLAVGLLIDDAIVVRENIFRKLEQGYSVKEAAEKGTMEVAMAVIATTLTIVAVFLPVGFLSGIVGQFFKQFALTVVFAILISLFDGLTVAPMLSAYFSGDVHAPRSKAVQLFDRYQDWQDGIYEKVLRFSIDNPLKVIAISVAILFISLGVAASDLVKKTFMPTGDQGEFMVSIELPPGTSIHATSDQAAAIEEELKKIHDVELIATVVGSQQGEKNKAVLGIKLTPYGKRDVTTTDVKAAVREMLAKKFQHTNPRVNDYSAIGGVQYPFTLNISGQDLKVLEAYSQKLLSKMRGLEELADVDASSRPGKPDFQIRIDSDRAKRTGVNPGMAGLELRYHVAGEEVAIFNENGIQYDVTIRAKPEQRNLQEAFNSVQVPNMQYRLIPLKAIASGSMDTSSAVIFRQDRSRVVQITANLAPPPKGALTSAIESAQKILKENPPPPGVTYAFVGQSEDMNELVANILLALGLAILLIYLTLSSLYESFITPITILIAIPPALSGAFFGLALMQKTLDIFSMIGIIMLVGLVVKNSILLVDHAMQEIRAGYDRKTAIYNAGAARLRPILMTTIAMIAGILPVAMGLGEVSKFRSSMGIAIIGGLIISTAITLVVVPAMFEYVDRLRVFIESRIGHQDEPNLINEPALQMGNKKRKH